MVQVPGWIDRADREPVSVAASLVLTDRNLPVQIINASADGCQIECEEMLPIGASVSLRLELVSFAATVRWAMLGKAGLKFVK